MLNNNGTNFLFTDALGSVVSTISNTANSASVGGNQVYGPYGNNPYSKGTMGTTRGYTGQYNDSLTQLDYYGARYYDPLVGVFLSADEVQGNPDGMNPYNYVGENPETNIDPNGEMYAPPPGSQPQGNPPYSPPSNTWTGPLAAGNSNVQPDSCTQMSQAGNSCQVAAGVQVTTRVTAVGRGAIGGSISVGCGVSVGVVAICTGFSSAPSGPQNVEIQSTLPFRICLPTIVCSDHGNASNDAGKAESDLSGDGGPDVVASTEGQSQIPDLREQLGFPEREVDPNQDDGKTVALLNADGNTYGGASGRNWNKIKGLIPGLSNSGGHAELDALSQLVSDRNASGITGGGGIMDIDRPPCISYCVSEYGNGNVLKAVEAAQLNYLEIEYGPGYEGGVYRPGGKMTIIPEDFIGYLI